MNLSVKQYADIKGITKQAITKKIRANEKAQVSLHEGLADIKRVEKVGNSYVLTTA